MLHIINAHLKPITAPDIPCGEILIDEGKIVAIGEKVSAPEGCEVFDALGCLVAPGFIDAHTHIGLHEEAVRWEGADYNEVSAPVTPEMRAIDAINPRLNMGNNFGALSHFILYRFTRLCLGTQLHRRNHQRAKREKITKSNLVFFNYVLFIASDFCL